MIGSSICYGWRLAYGGVWECIVEGKFRYPLVIILNTSLFSYLKLLHVPIKLQGKEKQIKPIIEYR